MITSSIAAVCTEDPTKIHTEDDWNNAAIKATDELGLDAGLNIYAAAKTHAERCMFLSRFTASLRSMLMVSYHPLAAWQFWEKNKKTVTWDLSVINPPFVFGVSGQFKLLDSALMATNLSSQ